MTQFLLGFFTAWFLVASVLLVVEETKPKSFHLFTALFLLGQEWLFWLLAAPAIVPAALVTLVINALKWVWRHLKKGWRFAR